MTNTFVGPQLRQLRRERHQTQAEMAKVLGISAGYVNLLENNERSLSLRLLMALADNYGVDWWDIVADKTSNLLAELRSVIKDPIPAALGCQLWGAENSVCRRFLAALSYNMPRRLR
jgi:XRE family transcriptional regulator, fatty acid utilization regulator